MVERVARALHDAQCSCGTWREPSIEWFRRGLLAGYDAEHYHSVEQIEGEWVEAARAAIAAMREPEEAMIEAGDGILALSENCASVIDIWEAMIDAALRGGR